MESAIVCDAPGCVCATEETSENIPANAVENECHVHSVKCREPMLCPGEVSNFRQTLLATGRTAEVLRVADAAIAPESNLWNAIPEDITQQLKGENLSFFFGNEQTDAPDKKTKFSFFREQITLHEAKKLSIYALLIFANSDVEFFIANGCLRELLGLFDRIYIDIILIVANCITAENKAAIHRLLNCGKDAAEVENQEQKKATRVDELQKFIVDKFSDENAFTVSQNAVTVDADVESFLKVFCSNCVKNIFTGTSQNDDVKSIENKLLTFGVTANFADNLNVAQACDRVFAYLHGQGHSFPKKIIAIEARYRNDLFGFIPGPKRPYFLKSEELRTEFVPYAPLLINKDIDNRNVSEVYPYAVEDASVTSSTVHLLNLMGRFYYFQNMHMDANAAIFEKYTDPNHAMHSTIRDEVAPGALISRDGSDFFTLVFTALVLGKTFGDGIMEIYRELKGPEVSSPLPVPEKLAED
ncbi:MAG: hypothetical protein LBT64_02660 [Puniceicoccales bacterium]|jgi:hypothetical protein|nr:hypothetical protein [Puniceicoccales bacterium]